MYVRMYLKVDAGVSVWSLDYVAAAVSVINDIKPAAESVYLAGTAPIGNAVDAADVSDTAKHSGCTLTSDCCRWDWESLASLQSQPDAGDPPEEALRRLL